MEPAAAATTSAAAASPRSPVVTQLPAPRGFLARVASPVDVMSASAVHSRDPIDVDWIAGSSFHDGTPKHVHPALLWHEMLRVFFAPAHVRFWIGEIGTVPALVLCAAAATQWAALAVWVYAALIGGSLRLAAASEAAPSPVGMSLELAHGAASMGAYAFFFARMRAARPARAAGSRRGRGGASSGGGGGSSGDSGGGGDDGDSSATSSSEESEAGSREHDSSGAESDERGHSDSATAESGRESGGLTGLRLPRRRRRGTGLRAARGGGGGGGGGGGSSAGEDSPGARDVEHTQGGSDACGTSGSGRKRAGRPPRVLLDAVHVTMWSSTGEPTKVALSLPDLARLVHERSTPPRLRWVEVVPPVGAVCAAVVPLVFRTFCSGGAFGAVLGGSGAVVETAALGPPVVAACVLALCLSVGVWSWRFFALLSETARALHVRYLNAKCFNALTSSSRSRRLLLPTFRLHKIAHIKMWLSLRSLLMRGGAHRAVDNVVSDCFVLVLTLVVTVMALHVVMDGESSTNSRLVYWLAAVWAAVTTVYLMRFMTTVARMHRKYAGAPVLLTEQINLFLRMLRAPHKKQELSVSVQVLKLAQKLLKELESSRSSAISISPLLISVTRVVLLSALSAVLSDVLGFNLRLWKLPK